jgi:small-conductance mechanosensitive channel
MTFDLSKVEGLSEDQIAAITAQHNTAVEQETAGLVNKTQELLNEKKTVQATAQEQAQALEQARQAAVKAEEERLKLAGDMDGLKSHYESQLAEQTAIAQQEAQNAKQALERDRKNTALNGALSLIHDDFKDVSSALLDSMIKIDYNEQGEALTKFMKDGNVVANSVDEFKGWAAEQDSFKRIMNGVNSSGANSTGGNGGGASSFAGKQYSEMSAAEKTAYLSQVKTIRN